MKNIRLLALTLLLVTGFAFPSCDKDTVTMCDCSAYSYFDVVGMEELDFYRESGNNRTLQPTDSISVLELGAMQLNLKVEFLASLNQSRSGFSLINSAMACSCAGGGKGAKTEKIEDLRIITLHDFDADHPADSDITAMFDFDGSITNQPSQPLLEYLEENKDEKMMFYLMAFRLKERPAAANDFQVRLELSLSSGERYSIQSNSFILTP
ncbi:MAG: hypothetical protein AAFO94_14765 [Bacteroidota bacterium]